MQVMRLALPLAALLASALVGCSGSGGANNSPGTGGSASSTGGSSGSAGSTGSAGNGGSAGSAGSGGCTADLQTDPDNCGVCGHSCLGGKCDAGVCQPLEIATTDPTYPTPMALAADADGIYFVGVGGVGDGALFVVPPNGGTPKRIAVLYWDTPSWIFPTADNVYVYTGECCMGTNTYTWNKKTKTGSRSGSASGTDTISHAWLGPKYAFFGADNRVYFDAPTNDVERTEFETQLEFPAVTGNSTWVFYTASSGSTHPIYRAKLAGLSLGKWPNPSPWIASGPDFSDIAANEEALFGTTGSEIDRFDVSSGAKSTVVSGISTFNISVDEKNVYWLGSSGSVLAAPVTGGKPRVIATPKGQLQALWVSDRVILWSTQSPNAVYLLAK